MTFDSLSLLCEKQLPGQMDDGLSLDDIGDLDAYIDNRVQRALGKDEAPAEEEPIYAVIPSSSQGNLTIFEIRVKEGEKGDLAARAFKKGQITPGGDLISSPIIRGKVVVYGVQKEDGGTAGEIRRLPGGESLPGFNVSPPAPGFTYQRVMGGQDAAEQELSVDDTPTPEPTSDEQPIPLASPRQVPIQQPTPQSNVNRVAAYAGISPAEFKKLSKELQQKVTNQMTFAAGKSTKDNPPETGAKSKVPINDDMLHVEY